MALYEVAEGRRLAPIRRLNMRSEVYEREVEDLFWSSPENFVGEAVFRVSRQARLSSGGIADAVLLDALGSVIVVEIKRDVDRSQLAQCLEYAGWARGAGLEELAGMYPAGADAFFSDWQDFTESNTPMRISRSPRIVLVAHEFHGRTESAFEFLVENGVPIQLIPIDVYEEASGRRLIDIGREYEPMVPVENQPAPITRRLHLVDGRRVTIADLMDAGLLVPGDRLVWNRTRVGELHTAEIRETGAIRLDDGREFASLSSAADAAAGHGSFDGWEAWRQERDGGQLLGQLRRTLIDQNAAS